MLAMQIIEWGKPLETREYPDPEPKGEEVLLRVEAAGVCHSDVHIWDGYFDLGEERRISLESRGVHLPFTYTCSGISAYSALKKTRRHDLIAYLEADPRPHP